MNKIKYVSLFFRLFFQASFICLIIAQVLGWVYAPMQINLFNPIPSFYWPYLPSEFDASTKIAGFFITLLPLTVKLLLVHSLIRLFRLYEQLDFFSASNVNYIRKAGNTLLLLQFVNPICEFALGFILTSHNPPGLRFASMTINDTNIGLILTALVIILISWIMSEGCKLNEEQRLTI